MNHPAAQTHAHLLAQTLPPLILAHGGRALPFYPL